MQALRHLRNVQVINFGDCLVRSEGAIALAAVLREGLPILKVRSHCSAAFVLVCLGLQADYSAVWGSLSSGAQSVLWRDHRGGSFGGCSGRHGQIRHGESGFER